MKKVTFNRPKDIPEKLWDLISPTIYSRIMKRAPYIPDFCDDFLKEKGYTKIPLIGIEEHIYYHKQTQSVYLPTRNNLWSTFNVTTRKRIRDETSESEFQSYVHTLSSNENFLLYVKDSYNHFLKDYAQAYIRKPFTGEEIITFMSKNEDEIEKQILNEHRIIYRYLLALQNFIDEKNWKENMLFTTPDSIVKQIQKEFPDMIDNIEFKDEIYTIVTKPLSVQLYKGKDTMLDIGVYRIRVTDGFGSCTYALEVERYGGTLSGEYISSYMIAEETDVNEFDNQLFEYGPDEWAPAQSICFGDTQTKIDMAKKAGDAFYILQQTLILLVQPNYESFNPHVTWVNLAQDMHPEWDWCQNCGLLECNCKICTFTGKKIHPDYFCTVCERGDSYCECILCGICNKKENKIHHRIKRAVFNISYPGIFQKEITFCTHCLEKNRVSTVQYLIDHFNSTFNSTQTFREYLQMYKDSIDSKEHNTIEEMTETDRRAREITRGLENRNPSSRRSIPHEVATMLSLMNQ